jgi:tetratricopeptide (TPR) repeat protein
MALPPHRCGASATLLGVCTTACARADALAAFGSGFFSAPLSPLARGGRPEPRACLTYYALIVGCYRVMGFKAEALTACQEGRQVYPEDTELLFLEGVLRRDKGDLTGAEACLIRLLESNPAAHFASVDAGLKGYKAWHNLGVVYLQQDRLEEAEAQWQKVLAQRPDFLPSWLGLSEAYTKRGAWDALEELAQRLEKDHPQGAREAPLMRARGLLAHQDYRAAQSLLEDTIERFPDDLMLRVLLSHVFLKEGKDELAAENALRAILVRDPHHPEARNNLSVLLYRQGRKLDGPGTDGVTLADLYEAARNKPSDINEHVPTLYKLAKECRHITEFGTRTAVSTTAFLYAQPERVVCYDLRKWPEVNQLEILAGRTKFSFHLANVLNVEIEDTDLLFIDTRHVHEQLQEELRLHAPKARKYIVLHDPATAGENGEGESRRRLWPAVEDFLAQGQFALKDPFLPTKGLTILARKPSAVENGELMGSLE